MHHNDSPTYDALSRLFHWITALAIVAAFVLGPEGFGRMMDDGMDPASHAGIVWHETLGLLVLAITVMRLFWMVARPAAPRPPMAPWMHALALLARLALWALLLAIPLTALMTLATEGYPLTLLGGLRADKLPLLSQLTLPFEADWGELHGMLGDAIMVVAGLHSAAALFHHFVLKDQVLRTMLPLRKRS